MASGPPHDKQMPDEVGIPEAATSGEKSHTRRVRHAPREKPEDAVSRHAGSYGVDGDHNEPSHGQI